jgi:hypothetical protein
MGCTSKDGWSYHTNPASFALDLVLAPYEVVSNENMRAFRVPEELPGRTQRVRY